LSGRLLNRSSFLSCSNRGGDDPVNRMLDPTDANLKIHSLSIGAKHLHPSRAWNLSQPMPASRFALLLSVRERRIRFRSVEECFNLLQRQRPAQEEALISVATKTDQEVPLLFRLHTFSDH